MDHTEILINIRKIIRSVNLESKRIQKEHGLSIPQYLCLNFLNTQPEFKATSKELKQYLNLNASTVTGIIVRLEKKGYIARLPNSNDGRSSFVHITALGVNTISKVPDLLHEKLSQKLKELEDNELHKVREALDLLIEFMEVGYLDASPIIQISDPSTGNQ